MSGFQVPGNPEALQGAARTLRSLASGVEGDRNAMHTHARGVTMGGICWGGKAANAFISSVNSKDENFNRLKRALNDSAGALETYASALSSAQQRAASLRSQALVLHLEIDAYGVVRQGPAFTSRGAPPPSRPPEADYLQAQAQQVLRSIDQAAAECKRRLDSARHSLYGEFSWMPSTDPSSLLAYGHNVLTGGPNAASALDEYYKRYKDQIRRANPKNSATRSVYTNWKRQMQAQRAAATRGPLGWRVWNRLNTSFGEIAGSSRWLRWGRAPVLNRLPVVGAFLTAGTIAYEIRDGKSPTASIVTNGASFVAGSLAGAAVAGAVAGTFVGAPVIAGVVVGLAVGYGVGKLGEWFFGQTDVGQSIARTVDNAVGGAARAVGGAISRGWKSLFG